MRWAALVLLALAGCATGTPGPARSVVPSPTGDVTWWGPTQDIADARARWYVDPSWRVVENIPALGYYR